MRILIVHLGSIPVTLYGGTERVIWSLGKELTKLGHQVSYLVKAHSYCDFASVLIIDPGKDLIDQIPDDVDVVHFNSQPVNIEKLKKPYIVTKHSNSNYTSEMDINTVFVSENHAHRYNSNSFVHNGLDWDDYTHPVLKRDRKYYHFLGNAAWRIKNVKGAIDVVRNIKGARLKVLGGTRFNIKMGIRLTFSHRIAFFGMVGGRHKDELLNGSKGLIFPVRWHEPFGLSIIESLYFGCPIFGTPYGSLPELVQHDVGYLSNKKEDLIKAVADADQYSPKRCHEYALEEFNSKKMTERYLKKYEQVMSGKTLNKEKPKEVVAGNDGFLAWS